MSIFDLFMESLQFKIKFSLLFHQFAVINQSALGGGFFVVQASRRASQSIQEIGGA